MIGDILVFRTGLAGVGLLYSLLHHRSENRRVRNPEWGTWVEGALADRHHRHPRQTPHAELLRPRGQAGRQRHRRRKLLRTSLARKKKTATSQRVMSFRTKPKGEKARDPLAPPATEMMPADTKMMPATEMMPFV